MSRRVVKDGRSRKIYSKTRQRARSVRILAALAEGKSRQEIAADEAIGEHYLRRLVGELREDFEARNDRHLVATAIREGVIE